MHQFKFAAGWACLLAKRVIDEAIGEIEPGQKLMKRKKPPLNGTGCWS